MPQAKKTRPARPSSQRPGKIGRDDWVRAGLVTLAQKGADAVRVEPIAERLGVTKGSFYWHFKNRAALHEAMLERWRAAGTRDVIDRIRSERCVAVRRLERLIELTAMNDKGAALEAAVRAWARTDPRAAAALADVDRQRLAYVGDILAECGVPRGPGEQRAKLLYLTLIGSFHSGQSAALAADAQMWRTFTASLTQGS